MKTNMKKSQESRPSGIHPIHRDLLIATSLGFMGAMGLLSTVILVFG